MKRMTAVFHRSVCMMSMLWISLFLLFMHAMAENSEEYHTNFKPGVIRATTVNATYYGGTVLSGGINIYIIYYGSSWTSSTKNGIASFLTSLGSNSTNITEPRLSQWWSILTQYDGPSGFYVSSNVSYKGSYNYPDISSNYSLLMNSTANGSRIINSSITSGTFPVDSNGMYIILTGNNVSVSDGCTSCSIYGYFSYDLATSIKYAWVHDATFECPTNCFPYSNRVPPSGNLTTDGVIYQLSAVVADVAVSPFLNGWTRSDGFAFASICGFGTEKINPSTGGSFNIYGNGNREYLIPQLYDRVASQCSLKPVLLSPPPPSPSPPLSPPPSPSPPSPSPPPPPPTKSSGSGIIVIIAAVAGILAAVVIIALCILVFCCCGKKKDAAAAPVRQPSHFPPAVIISGQIVDVGNGHYTRQFTLEEVKAATDSFSEQKLLGKGGFGSVYEGSFLQGGIWAVKRAHSRLVADQISLFVNEVKLIAKVSHTNVVSLKGFCDEEGEKILIYEYVANGNLRQHILRDGKFGGHVLSLHRRVKIAIGAAKGLEYLHGFEGSPIIHRDVKTENILLDAKFTPKVADFGLLAAMDDAATHVSADVAGTYGYLDPEYISTKKVTTKSDVYSFGIILLELVTGRKPTVMSSNEELDDRVFENITVWVKNSLQRGGIGKVVDPFISSDYSVEVIRKIIDLAQWCTKYESRLRPTMREVVSALEQIEKEIIRDGDSSVASGSVAGESSVIGHNDYPQGLGLGQNSASYDHLNPEQSTLFEAPVSFAPRGR